MNTKVCLFLKRRKDFATRIILLLRDHTIAQIWNVARMKLSQRKSFGRICLPYEPVYLALMVTLRCNLCCPWCAYRNPDVKAYTTCSTDMDMETFKRIATRFKRALWLELTGGEPFIHHRIFEMIDYAHERRLKIHIPTNGLLIHGLVDRIARSPLQLLNVSLNACDSEEFFQLHGISEHNYHTLLRDLRKLVETRNIHNKQLKIQLSYVCHKANYESIPKMLKLADDLQVDQMRFRNLVPHGIPGFPSSQCLYEDDQEVMEVIKSTPSPSSGLQVAMPRLYKHKYVNPRCNMPFTALYCNPAGDISPCCRVPRQSKYGNILTDVDVWNNSTLQAIREVFVNESVPLPEPCKSCPDLLAQ